MFKVKSRGILTVISGPSGAGKGTIIKELLKSSNNFWLSISMTTREPRGLEKDGIDYYFVSKETFLENIENNNFLEYAKVHSDHYYGTPKSNIENKLEEGIDVILEIDIQGALEIKKTLPDSLFIFILPPSMEELKNRLIRRDTEVMDKILERFKKSYTEINEMPKYNYVVINDEVEIATHKIKSIIEAEKCRVDRIEDFDLNSKEEIMHENLVD